MASFKQGGSFGGWCAWLSIKNNILHSCWLKNSDADLFGDVREIKVNQNTFQATILTTAKYLIRRAAVSSRQRSTLNPDFMTLK